MAIEKCLSENSPGMLFSAHYEFYVTDLSSEVSLDRDSNKR